MLNFQGFIFFLCVFFCENWESAGGRSGLFSLSLSLWGRTKWRRRPQPFFLPWMRMEAPAFLVLGHRAIRYARGWCIDNDWALAMA
ncbi:hypothetical protein V8C34DRAFT_283203 [Trichoderma compactum]